MSTILIVTSDRELAEGVKETLTREGIEVFLAAPEAEALSLLDGQEVEVVVLDLDSSGDCQLCWEIRERTIAPLLVLAEDSHEAATLARGLEWGADAYLVKPFTVQVFLAQVYALLRRIGLFRPGHAGQLEVEGLRINVTRQEVTIDGRNVGLTPTEYKILSVLLRNAGRPLSHRSLVKEALGYDCYLSEAREILKVHIHHLRQKIEPQPRGPRFIRSVRGFGYIFERRRYDREGLDRTLTKP